MMSEKLSEKIKNMKEVTSESEIKAIRDLVTERLVDVVGNNCIYDTYYEKEDDDYYKSHLNFCAVRDKKVDNSFNDVFYMYWYEDDKWHCYRTQYGFITKSGFEKIRSKKGKGTKTQPVLIEGWHKNIWGIDKHKGAYDALVQRVGNHARFKRADKYNPTTGLFKYDFDNDFYILDTSVGSIKTGSPGINLHRTFPNDDYPNTTRAIVVNNWSGGCQAFADKYEFDDMMTAVWWAKDTYRQKKFSYFICTKEAYKHKMGVDVPNLLPSGYEETVKSHNATLPKPSASGNASVSSATDSVSLGNVNVNSEDEVTYNSALGRIYDWFTDLGSNKDEIFFPFDDNNDYINLSSEKIEVKVVPIIPPVGLPVNLPVGLSDKYKYYSPLLKVDELKISNKSYATMGVYPELISYSIPIVFINNFMIPQTNITNFCLDYSSFVPQVMVEFVDISNELLTTNIPKPGSYIKVFIGGYPKTEGKDFYKPIRQNFVITNISKTNKTAGEYQNYPNSGNPLKYKITGILNVPLGFSKCAVSTKKIIAMEALMGFSRRIGLGFATNFNDTDKVKILKGEMESKGKKFDYSMKWLNTQNKSLYDFLREITQHSVYSKYTFFTSFIDQYYFLNYVECRSLLSRGGEKEDTKQIIYNCIMPEMNKSKTDVEQKESYYFLTNSAEYKGWTNYIEEYYELNDGYSMMTDGFTKVLTYSNSTALGKNNKIILKAVDNLERDVDGKIIPLPKTVNKDTYIPLNLVETADPAYVEVVDNYNCPVASETNVDIGYVDTSNTYPLYPFGPVQNDFQMKNLKKCGLSIRLQNYNPSITKYSRIWVDLYDMNRNSMTQIRKDPSIENMKGDSDINKYLKAKNDNIIAFDEETSKDTENQVYNRSLSGWYVITEMKISYNTVKDFKGGRYKKLQTHLILNRIDYRPSFHSEYKIAKNAIAKYSADTFFAGIYTEDE